MQLNELAERLKFIEQKLLENEMNTEKKFKNISQNITSSYQPQLNHPNQFNQQQNKENSSLQNITNHNAPPTYSQINFRQQPFQIQQKNQDDFSLKNGQFHNRIYPSISFGDCSDINVNQNKNQKKSPRNFFASARLSVKNSKSIPSCKSKNFK